MSVTDPYANCVGVGAGPQFGAENYPNTEPEVWEAKNPANPNNFIGALQQDRWNDGGDKGLTASWSFDNGYHWGETALPFSLCAGPYYGGNVLPTERASDPWVDVGPDGRAYSVSISFDENTFKNGVGAATSTDGGVTWQNQKFVDFNADVGPLTAFDDKESVTADPTVAGAAYVVWDQLRFNIAPTCPRGQGETDIRVARRSGGSDPVVCFTGPAMFSRTVDGGLTWSPPAPIVGTPAAEQTISNQIVVDPRTGRLYDFYERFTATSPTGVDIRMVSSDDKGTTWSPEQVVVPGHNPVGIHDPQTGAGARTGDIIPEPAIDRKTGQLYVAFQDSRFNANGEDDVLFSTSVASGLTGTWTMPQRVNLPEDRAGFTPGIKVNDLSQLGIDYFSLRHPELGPGVWPVERYLRDSSGPAVVSTPTPGAQPVASITFNTPTHVAGPFNMLAAPNAGGFFVGDYESMTIDRDGKSFHTFYSATNCDDVNCTAPFNPTGAPESSKAPPDPLDVYTAAYYKAQ
ncbi:MAG TPA: sialidase family protein [Candidatus Dormibacteraeota bacterium]